MGIAATYLSPNSFSVSGDMTSELVEGRRIKADCGDDGIKYSLVVSSSYTTVTVVEVSVEDLTSNLIGIQYMGSGGNWVPETWRDSKLILPRLV